MLFLHVEILVSAQTPIAKTCLSRLSGASGIPLLQRNKKGWRSLLFEYLSGSKIVCRRHCELSRSDW
jgi:hypothetical protein